MKKMIVTRDVTPEECHWLPETVTKDTVVYKYYGYTYGCISPAGIAVSEVEDETPFFELPIDSVKEIE